MSVTIRVVSAALKVDKEKQYTYCRSVLQCNLYLCLVDRPGWCSPVKDCCWLGLTFRLEDNFHTGCPNVRTIPTRTINQPQTLTHLGSDL